MGSGGHRKARSCILPGLSNKNADGGLDIVAYLDVSSYRVPRRKEEACCSRQHFNHAHPITYSHQTSYIRTPANCIILMLHPCLALNAVPFSKHLPPNSSIGPSARLVIRPPTAFTPGGYVTCWPSFRTSVLVDAILSPDLPALLELHHILQYVRASVPLYYIASKSYMTVSSLKLAQAQHRSRPHRFLGTKNTG